MDTITKREEVDRFNTKWLQNGDCKVWDGPLDKDGYGTFYFKKKTRKAHRVAYYFMNGPIPEGMVIDHVCRNRSCVEATHLRVVTPRENTLNNSRSLGAINKLKELCKNGHRFDRVYSGQRYCSTCEKAKKRRLKAIWKIEADKIAC